ncbi:MAG: aminopeptidase N [Pseudohongiellaceae bacterium]|jgi:aminopeptidase N
MQETSRRSRNPEIAAHSQGIGCGLRIAATFPEFRTVMPTRSPQLQTTVILLLLLASACAGPPEGFTRQDQLRGSIAAERSWWDVQHYDLSLEVFPEEKRIEGSNTISFQTLSSGQRMQIDLQEPLAITHVLHGNQELTFEREGNVYWVSFASPLEAGTADRVEIFYEGAPKESENPPWSGGFSWDEDELGRPFIATTCQGLGASVWWPNKDHGYDEPDQGMDIRVTVPAALTAVSNGRLLSTDEDSAAGTRSFHWRVTNPINNYGVNVNIGTYVSMPGVYDGEFGELDTTYWVLDHQVDKAREQFKEAPRTLAAFEHWFGKYPFYEDSYKLVVVPYLGMEHQSSVTYGNGFANGYRGRDLSKTGVGLKFDYIVIHETAHEWWGNNISMRDTADMWIHESFASYAENLFVEYHFTEKEAQDYVIGCRAQIRNDTTIIGEYGLNHSGSGDMYPKGANMLHTMRHILNDDLRWRSMLRGLNAEFWHKTISTEEFEAYISQETGFGYGRVFDQYLRTTDIPELKYSSEYRASGPVVELWWDNVVPGFDVPVLLTINGTERRLHVSDKPIAIALERPLESLALDRNFYMTVEGQ